MEGNIYGPIETTQMYVDILTEFKAANPDFIGAKFIYAPIRRVSVEEFKKYRPITEALLAKFPDFVMGFDVVGQEDMGTPLKDFASEILQYPENINFFWHAGETNWNGRTSDENLVSGKYFYYNFITILLNCKNFQDRRNFVGHKKNWPWFWINKIPDFNEAYKAKKHLCRNQSNF